MSLGLLCESLTGRGKELGVNLTSEWHQSHSEVKMTPNLMLAHETFFKGAYGSMGLNE